MSSLPLSSLTALSSVDGRYASKTAALRPWLSEFGLIRHRVNVEIEWLRTLAAEPGVAEVPSLSAEADAALGQMFDGFSEESASRVKEIERTTNHDVKAVEYWIKEQIDLGPSELKGVKEFVHFSCTSEDVNNLAYGTMLKGAVNEVVVPSMASLRGQLVDLAHEHADLPMLCRTHGQPATPSTLGKEVANFAYRMQRPLQAVQDAEIFGKFNGAVGNFNAHAVAYPNVDWEQVATSFVEDRLGLTYNPYTTQIEPHDFLATLFHATARYNTVLLDLCRDFWLYTSIGYLKQRAVAGEIGSSTMPHKVNPIDFENAEGNIGLANATFDHLANKLPVSRYQRDLSDSTVLRSIGVGFAHSLIAYASAEKGLSRVDANQERLLEDLDGNWEVLAEPIQTVMRRHGVEGAYERLKDLTRGQRVSQESMQAFVQTLRGEIPDEDVEALSQLTPSSYLGYAARLARGVSK